MSTHVIRIFLESKERYGYLLASEDAQIPFPSDFGFFIPRNVVSTVIDCERGPQTTIKNATKKRET